MSEWQIQSDRETVKTLLAMGFIPTWLEELLDYGDLIEKQADHYSERALIAEKKLRTIKELLRNAPIPPDEVPDAIMKILSSKQSKRGKTHESKDV